MPPQLALLATVFFVVGILMADCRRKPEVSSALWIPFAWFVIIASRPVVLWLNPSSAVLGAGVEDGSAMDRAFLSVLMLVAAVILVRRRLQWTQWFRGNPWIFLFLLYCGISILWSDFPAIAFKRWVRALGSLMMILVVLSEADPVAAIATLVRRSAYVLIPFSLVLIKYYRSLAVGYNQWTGEEYLVGVTTDKNALGRLCLICGLFVFWELISTKSNEHIDRGRLSRVIVFTVFVLILWLLWNSKSATSLAAFVFGCGVLLALGRQVFRRQVKRLGTLIMVFFAMAFLFSTALSLPERIVTSLGRDLTFTDRTFVWADLLKVGTNPIVGVGYDSFWLGSRLDQFVRDHQVNEAHNGYLEVYLELGAIGLVLLVGIVFSIFRRSKETMVSSFDFGRLRIVLLFVFLLYNLTEAGYKATTSIAFVLLLVAIESPARSQQKSPVPVAPRRPSMAIRSRRTVYTASHSNRRKAW